MSHQRSGPLGWDSLISVGGRAPTRLSPSFDYLQLNTFYFPNHTMTTTRHSRTRLKRAALLSLLPFTTAFVVPPRSPLNSDQSVSTTASSVRKTINFGPHVVTDSYSVDRPSSALRLWNAAAPTLSIQSADLSGRELARAFGELSAPH
jgi:hypothetical protein